MPYRHSHSVKNRVTFDYCINQFQKKLLFNVKIFYCIRTEYGDLQSKSRIHSECGVINTLHLMSEHCLVILTPLYCKFTVISWLND